MVHSRKWSVNFRSLKGVECVVYIHAPGVNNTITELVGSSEPIYYTEDTDTDILQVVRYKTGYINLIETSYGELNEVFPTTPKDRFVEFWYGGRLDFVGYLQMQTFDNEWIDGNREVQIPIMSPLGLSEVYNFNPTPPVYRTLGNILREALSIIEYQYEKIVFPSSTLLNEKLNSVVVCPFSSDFFQKYGAGVAELMSPIPLVEFLEGLCHLFGWMVHDEGTSLVFSQIDWDGGYSYYTYGNLINPVNVADAGVSGSSDIDVEDSFTLADDDGKHSYILPLQKITIKYDGDFVTRVGMDLSHTSYNLFSYQRWPLSFNSMSSAAWLKRIIKTEYFGDYLLDTNYIYGSAINDPTPYGRLQYNGVMMAEAGANYDAFGGGYDQKVRVLIQPSSNWPSGTVLFGQKFYKYPLGYIRSFRIEMSCGDTIAKLNNSLPDNISLDVTVSNGSNEATSIVQVSQNDGVGEIKFDLSIINFEIVNEGYFTISIKKNQNTNLRTDKIYSIDNFEVTVSKVLPGNYIGGYVYPEYSIPNTQEDTITGTAQSFVFGDVNMLFSPYRKNSNMLGTAIETLPTDLYKYVFTQQQTLEVRFRLEDFPSDALYTYKFNYWGKTWRILSYSFNPYDDEVTLMLYHAPILDN